MSSVYSNQDLTIQDEVEVSTAWAQEENYTEERPSFITDDFERYFPDSSVLGFEHIFIKYRCTHKINQNLNSDMESKRVTNNFLSNLYNKLNTIRKIHEEWAEELNVELPNDFAIELTRQLLKIIVPLFIIPEKISPTIEEGICLSFKNEQQTLFVEIYNTGELGYIIENWVQKRVIENEDVFSINEITDRIIRFFEQ